MYFEGNKKGYARKGLKMFFSRTADIEIQDQYGVEIYGYGYE